jgi:hypothetical protein
MAPRLPKIKELTKRESADYVKELMKTKTNIKKKFQPGRILFYQYNAKDKTQTYDKTPLVMVLKSNKSHMLGLNFHWLPMPLRVLLIKKIISLNKQNIKNKVPLEFSYRTLKPFLKKLGYAPCIRLYIRTRVSTAGVLIPDSQLMNVARLKSETFTKGKVSAEELYKRALNANKKYRTDRKRRQ